MGNQAGDFLGGHVQLVSIFLTAADANSAAQKRSHPVTLVATARFKARLVRVVRLGTRPDAVTESQRALLGYLLVTWPGSAPAFPFSQHRVLGATRLGATRGARRVCGGRGC